LPEEPNTPVQEEPNGQVGDNEKEEPSSEALAHVEEQKVMHWI